jgi:hypothetical protein
MFDSGLTYWFDGVYVLRYNSTSEEDVEKLFIEIYRPYLHDLNSIRSIRPWLDTFPMTPDSLSFCLGFDDASSNPVLPPNIATINLDRGTLHFSKYVGNQPGSQILYKPFNERQAREITGLKDLYCPQCPRQSVNPRPRLPEFIPIRGSYDSPIMMAQIELVKKFCATNNLAITTFGTVGKHYFDSRAFDFALRSSQSISLEQAKALATRCNKELVSFAQTSQVYKDYIKERSTWKHERYPSPTPIPEQFAYRISFWDENIDRPVAPYIAEIRLLDGKLSYFTADDNQHLVLVFEESFADSLANRPTVSATESENPK